MKTKSAAEAATKAAQEAQSGLRRLSLVSLLPQLTRIDDEIDRAVEYKAADHLRFWISQWNWQASQTRGYLNSTTQTDDDDKERIMKLLQASIVAAGDVRRGLHNAGPDEMVSVTEELRKQIGRVTAELGTLAAQQGVATANEGQDRG